MKLHIPGLPPIVQRAFDTLLNRGIGRDNLSNDALAGMIVESGSNANGEYVRWGNGFQVCYHRLDIGYLSGVQSFSWTYPAAFASSNDAYPMGIVATSNPRPSVFGQYVKSAVRRSLEALATQTTFFVEFSSAPTTYIQIFAFAIGRWK